MCSFEGYSGTSFIEDEDEEDFLIVSTIDNSNKEAGFYCLMGLVFYNVIVKRKSFYSLMWFLLYCIMG